MKEPKCLNCRKEIPLVLYLKDGLCVDCYKMLYGDRIPNMIRFDVLLKLFKYEINEFTPKEESDE